MVLLDHHHHRRRQHIVVNMSVMVIADGAGCGCPPDLEQKRRLTSGWQALSPSLPNLTQLPLYSSY